MATGKIYVIYPSYTRIHELNFMPVWLYPRPPPATGRKLYHACYPWALGVRQQRTQGTGVAPRRTWGGGGQEPRDGGGARRRRRSGEVTCERKRVGDQRARGRGGPEPGDGGGGTREEEDGAARRARGRGPEPGGVHTWEDEEGRHGALGGGGVGGA